MTALRMRLRARRLGIKLMDYGAAFLAVFGILNLIVAFMAAWLPALIGAGMLGFAWMLFTRAALKAEDLDA